MVRYQIIIAYDGTDFSGSQKQANTRTVQDELEKALQKLEWQGSSVLLAGRTDTGVHASGQVAAFDMEWNHSLSDLQNALNANLPMDISVRQIESVNSDFHPRFDANWRRYRYRIISHPVRDPLRERFSWRIWPGLTNLKPLADIWEGTHDFAKFGSPPRTGGSTTRTVFDANWKQCEDEWCFEIKANAFLYHMVRRIVFAQISVSQGKITLQDLKDALEGSFELPSGLAPPNGLILEELNY
ncbi:tRNA pseudouridine(38-40) synthase TruA [Chloroflexota bacterium]